MLLLPLIEFTLLQRLLQQYKSTTMIILEIPLEPENVNRMTKAKHAVAMLNRPHINTDAKHPPTN